MATNSLNAKTKHRRILVAGDVCLDVVGVPIPPKAAEAGAENWRLSGETRTHFLPGGAMLLAKFIRASRLSAPLAAAEKKAAFEIEAKGLAGEAARQHLQARK